MSRKEDFVSCAMLTAIWDEKQLDNIDLLANFIKYAIHKQYKKGEAIDCNRISDELNTEFSFVDFPIAVIKKILDRLKKKKYVYLNNKTYFLNADLENEMQNFISKRNVIKENMTKVIQELQTFFVNLGGEFAKLKESKIEGILISFLREYGYITYSNISKLNNPKEFNNDKYFFQIGKFLINHNKNNTVIFDYILQMTTGLMIASVINIQVENDNRRNLKNLSVYIDAPLMLCVLGYKKNEQNKNAEQLINILKEKNANIKIFTHNYEEVENILNSFKNSINSKIIKEKTLEGLEEQNITVGQMDIIISGLKQRIHNLGITIENMPEYKEEKYVIDENGLIEYLEKNYTNKETRKESIETDVKSISAIYRLRKKMIAIRSVEDSKAIFVTNNYGLIGLVDTFLEEKKKIHINSLINDIELLTLMWLKSYKNNPELPKIKLIENAVMALEPSQAIMKKLEKTIELLEADGEINIADIKDKIIEQHYFEKEVMEVIEGDVTKLNKNVVKGILEKDNLVLQNELNREKEINQNLERKNLETENELKEIRNNKINYCSKRADEFKNRIDKCIIWTIYPLLLVGLGVGIYYKAVVDKDIVTSIILSIFEIGGLIDFSYSKLNIIKKAVQKSTNKIRDWRYQKLLYEEQGKDPKLFD